MRLVFRTITGHEIALGELTPDEHQLANFLVGAAGGFAILRPISRALLRSEKPSLAPTSVGESASADSPVIPKPSKSGATGRSARQAQDVPSAPGEAPAYLADVPAALWLDGRPVLIEPLESKGEAEALPDPEEFLNSYFGRMERMMPHLFWRVRWGPVGEIADDLLLRLAAIKRGTDPAWIATDPRRFLSDFIVNAGTLDRASRRTLMEFDLLKPTQVDKGALSKLRTQLEDELLHAEFFKEDFIAVSRLRQIAYRNGYAFRVDRLFRDARVRIGQDAVEHPPLVAKARSGCTRAVLAADRLGAMGQALGDDAMQRLGRVQQIFGGKPGPAAAFKTGPNILDPKPRRFVRNSSDQTTTLDHAAMYHLLSFNLHRTDGREWVWLPSIVGHQNTLFFFSDISMFPDWSEYARTWRQIIPHDTHEGRVRDVLGLTEAIAMVRAARGPADVCVRPSDLENLERLEFPLDWIERDSGHAGHLFPHTRGQGVGGALSDAVTPTPPQGQDGESPQGQDGNGTVVGGQ